MSFHEFLIYCAGVCSGAGAFAILFLLARRRADARLTRA